MPRNVVALQKCEGGNERQGCLYSSDTGGCKALIIP